MLVALHSLTTVAAYVLVSNVVERPLTRFLLAFPITDVLVMVLILVSARIGDLFGKLLADWQRRGLPSRRWMTTASIEANSPRRSGFSLEKGRVPRSAALAVHSRALALSQFGLMSPSTDVRSSRFGTVRPKRSAANRSSNKASTAASD